MTKKFKGQPFNIDQESLLIVGTLDENNQVVPVINSAGEPVAFQAVTDRFVDTEVLPDQQGAESVLTFTFSSPVQLVWVRSVGGDSRVHPSGGTPTSTFGIRAPDDEPVPITVQTNQIKVWAPSTATITVWGFRY